MYSRWTKHKKGLSKSSVVIGLLSVLALVMLVAVACGEEATPTPVPASATAVPPTQTPIIQVVTATPVPTGLRPMSEWTADNPATLAEIEAELEKHRGESLVYVSWGGAYQGAQRQAYLIPFETKFGIRIIEESPVETPKIRAMVQAGNVTWDVVIQGNRSVWRLGPEGTLEELTPAIHNRYLSGYPEIVRTPYNGGGGDLWATALAYSLDSYPEGTAHPSSWADFWDVEKFPGNRSMHGRPNEPLFFAYFAAHPEVFDTAASRTSHASLTDAQLEEAWAKLREIKPNIKLWWSNGSDCPSLLISGELDMCSAWNGRIWDAQKTGAPIALAWEAGFPLQTESYTIPKGSPKKELAELFIAWTGFAENNVRIARYITYGPINQDSNALFPTEVSQEVQDNLPSSHMDKAVVVDEQWLGENLDAFVEQFQAYLNE